MMKILFITTNTEGYVCVDWEVYLQKEIAKIATCKWAGVSQQFRWADTTQAVDHIMPDADWVFVDGLWHTIPKQRDYRVCVHCSDLHYSINLQGGPDVMAKRMNEAAPDAWMLLYTKTPYRNHPIEPLDPDFYIKTLKAPIFHLAASVDRGRFHPHPIPKRFDASFMGATHPAVYPLRHAMATGLPALAASKGWKTFIGNTPPATSETQSWLKDIKILYDRGYPVGDRYAEYLSASKVFLFDCSIFRYPLLKYPESMGCGTVAMADAPLTAERLHLEPGWNYVEVNPGNWKDRLEYILTHDREREAIAENGLQTTLKYNVNEVRAAETIAWLKEHS